MTFYSIITKTEYKNSDGIGDDNLHLAASENLLKYSKVLIFFPDFFFFTHLFQFTLQKKKTQTKQKTPLSTSTNLGRSTVHFVHNFGS
ncbi:hypothetical protein GDO86_001112 [Hymenochirus boettgeri]|uniref:Uncharacterized protein n=1 Tax=Hymenochirus boettgeri TaxID=247094 RepID=A0A8T2KJR9_9PIPI|nr:hypothetical protein GDO86_001112 [Hymenochirus boettgeri]